MADDLFNLSRDFGKVPESSGQNIRKAVEVNARLIKDAWRDKVSGARALPGLAGALSYDLGSEAGHNLGAVSAEIGFDKGRSQGPLGNVSEFGTKNNAGRGYGAAALAENAEDLEQGVQKAIDDALREAGL